MRIEIEGKISYMEDHIFIDNVCIETFLPEDYADGKRGKFIIEIFEGPAK